MGSPLDDAIGVTYQRTRRTDPRPAHRRRGTCVAATAAELPFDDRPFDAAMAVATVHHWPDPVAGLLELRRVARRVAVFTHDTRPGRWLERFWLTCDYLPEVADLLVGRPAITDLGSGRWHERNRELVDLDAADLGLRLLIA